VAVRVHQKRGDAGARITCWPDARRSCPNPAPEVTKDCRMVGIPASSFSPLWLYWHAVVAAVDGIKRRLSFPTRLEAKAGAAS
jgi:hypothetical protein